MGVTCLTQAESDLLYVRTTQNYDSPYSKSQNATSSGYNSGGGGKKDNKTNGKQINQTAGSKKQQGNGGNNSSGNSSSGSPKKPRRCSYCALPAASHGHVLECRKIENVPAEMMYKFCHQLSACTSCLLTNQYTDWNRRGAWFTAHEQSCNRDFVCRVGNCDSKPPISQAHVVVCHEHHEDNKAKIDEFLSANQKYANLQYYAFPSHLKETDSAANKQEEKEVIPDTKDRACFTMQEVSDKQGGSLLVMYDSGAMTSAVTVAAAARLKAETVQPGPISYTTFGGESRENKGGIVAFTLPMDDGRLISMSALVMDEITGYIPKQHMKEAFGDLEAEFKGKNGRLPRTDFALGGRHADILIGAEYQHLFPQVSTVFSSASGLSIGRAKLASASGRQGVLSGPHRSFNPSATRAMLFLKESSKGSAEPSLLFSARPRLLSEFFPFKKEKTASSDSVAAPPAAAVAVVAAATRSSGPVHDVAPVDSAAAATCSASSDSAAAAVVATAATAAPVNADSQLCGPKVAPIDLSAAQTPCQADKEKGESIKRFQMLSGALGSVIHARSLPNVVVQTSPKQLSSCDASSTALSRFPTLMHSAYVCVLSVELRESQAVQLEMSSSKHPNKGVLLAPLISPSAASSWRPPGSCKLTSLLSKPTNDTHTSGQAVFITPESPGVSAHAGLRDSSEHARAWVSFKEGVG